MSRQAYAFSDELPVSQISRVEYILCRVLRRKKNPVESDRKERKLDSNLQNSFSKRKKISRTKNQSQDPSDMGQVEKDACGDPTDQTDRVCFFREVTKIRLAMPRAPLAPALAQPLPLNYSLSRRRCAVCLHDLATPPSARGGGQRNLG